MFSFLRVRDTSIYTLAKEDMIIPSSQSFSSQRYMLGGKLAQMNKKEAVSG